MWKRIKNIASFIDDYLIGIMLFSAIVASIMMMTAQSFVIFIFGFALFIGTCVLPFLNDKILKIAREKETQTKKATTSDYLFWKKVEAILDWFVNPIRLGLTIVLSATASASLASVSLLFRDKIKISVLMGVGSILFFILAIVIAIGSIELWDFARKKVRKIEEDQKQGSVNPIVEEKKEYNTEAMNNQKVKEMICEIDQSLKEGYAFKTISIDKWKNGYRSEIVNLCSCKYELDSDTEKRILSILQILKNDLIDQYYTAYEIKKETTVSALEKLADMDGLTELTLNIRK